MTWFMLAMCDNNYITWCIIYRHQTAKSQTIKSMTYDNGMYITECTLELQRLSRGELAELTGRQRELVALKLQRDRGLWLGDSILTARYVGQLGNLHNISTFKEK